MGWPTHRTAEIYNMHIIPRGAGRDGNPPVPLFDQKREFVFAAQRMIFFNRFP